MNKASSIGAVEIIRSPVSCGLLSIEPENGKKMVWRTAYIQCRPTPCIIIINLLLVKVKNFAVFPDNFHALHVFGFIVFAFKIS